MQHIKLLSRCILSLTAFNDSVKTITKMVITTEADSKKILQKITDAAKINVFEAVSKLKF